ncbi:helix-turn-helix transcriptional regulator [Bradyrhizobium jicamae]|uniref:helix-turn-helix transcriptional regulator n=1 Tax=Bradyrhizobium jicamae TaxID=280332 RepID=UPI001BA6EF9E|nr:AraC family transcriptional regulator [Bradyrhizobium jicamae]MBR0755575.1 helix-turn-helix transcriptional regulator [Bradyrhizobium jicamae]
MRAYDAPLISRRALRFGAVQIEKITRHLKGGKQALHVCLPQHLLYLELTSGARCERRIDGARAKVFDSRPGLLSFRPAGSEIRGWTEGVGEHRYCAIHIDPAGFEGDGRAGVLHRSWQAATACEDRSVWREAFPLLRACDRMPISESPMDRFYAEGHAVALLAVLATRFSEPAKIVRGGLPPRRLNKLMDYIQVNLCNKISLRDMASVAQLSESQFVRAFRASTGSTPIAYVADLRLRETRRLLVSTNLSLCEIALRLGFADQSHFTRRFRVATGMTPSLYRRMAA